MIRVRKADWENSFDILIGHPRNDGTVDVAAPVTWVTTEIHNAVEPTARLKQEDFQQLCDELYRLGFRPSDQKDPNGELAATKYHLEDMRKLAFKDEVKP